MPSLANQAAKIESVISAALQLITQFHTVTNLPRRYVAELIIIRVFSLFESIVEDAACRMICGASYYDGTHAALQRARPCRGFEQARLAMRTFNRQIPRNELRWGRASDIADNLEMLFPRTEHFIATLLGHGIFVSDLRKVRNHIAHGNQGTHRAFQDVVANRYGVRIPGVTPATLLLSPRFRPILVEQYCLQTRAVLRAAIKA